MIITCTKHGRSKRGHAALVRHLAKTENEEAILAEIGNCIAETLPELIETMEIYASAGRVGLHHATINPAKDICREQLVQAVHKVRLELDRDGSRPFGIVIHRKKRSEAGGADEHAHLVLGAVDAGGKALDDGWTKVRTERVARELEYDLGENPLCGRHHRPVLKALYTTRPEVYVWLLDAFGPNPQKPQSAISPGARNRARAQNLNLPKAKACVRSVWQKSENFSEFQIGLKRFGLSLVAGEKSNVFVILDDKGRLIGAANRILKMRREQFNTMMEASNESAVRSAAITDVDCPRAAFVGSDQLSSPEDRRIGAAVDVVEFGTDSGRGLRPNSTNHRLAGSVGREWAPPRTAAVGDKARSRFRNARAIARFQHLDLALVLSLAAKARSLPAIPFDEADEASQQDLLVHKDIWGVAILPKPR